MAMMVRSGQVRVFNVHIHSKLLSGTGKGGGRGAAQPALASTSSATGVRSRRRVFEVLWKR